MNRAERVGIAVLVATGLAVGAAEQPPCLAGVQLDCGGMPASVPDDFRLALQRTACLGFCPVYTLTILADGTVEYDGEEYVTFVGKARSQVRPEIVGELLDAACRARLASCLDVYDHETCPESVTCGPWANVSLRANGQTKEVHHYLGCGGLPELATLERLEDLIDTLAGSERWVGRRPG